MGHEIIIFGSIQGLVGRNDWARKRNESAIAGLPVEDEHPWFNRDLFSFAENRPMGIYQTQVFHFGLSMKDGPPLIRDGSYESGYHPIENWRNAKRRSVTEWIQKFENLLRKMFWFGADVFIETEFEPTRLFSYELAPDAHLPNIENATPVPDQQWLINVIAIPGKSNGPVSWLPNSSD